MYEKGMPQNEVTALVRTYLKLRPGEFCGIKEIMQATGVPKERIDDNRILSLAPDIERKIVREGGKKKVQWTYRDRSTSETLVDPGGQFSEWSRWDDRRELIEDIAYGGVYVFAHSKNKPTLRPSSDAVLPECVIYVGETKHLSKRPLTVHNRIIRYVQHFGDPRLENLWVSIFHAFRVDDPHQHLLRRFTEFLESKLIWEYTKSFGKPPELHYKIARRT